jgi:hypothetical protein
MGPGPPIVEIGNLAESQRYPDKSGLRFAQRATRPHAFALIFDFSIGHGVTDATLKGRRVSFELHCIAFPLAYCLFLCYNASIH